VRVLDTQGRVVAQQDSSSAAGRLSQGTVRFNLADQPAGAYLLDAKVWQEGDPGALDRRAKFSIGWMRDTWERNAVEVADEVHFLLEARDEEEFTGMQPGEQERLLTDFWHKRDPTPETATTSRFATASTTQTSSSRGSASAGACSRTWAASTSATAHPTRSCTR
jgi:hypothetical protein